MSLVLVIAFLFLSALPLPTAPHRIAPQRTSTRRLPGAQQMHHVDVTGTGNSSVRNHSILEMQRSVFGAHGNLHSISPSQTANMHRSPRLVVHKHGLRYITEHSNLWQAGLPCAHDSRVNLHISTDYRQKQRLGGLAAFLHGSSERSSTAKINPNFPFAVVLAVGAPASAIGGRFAPA